MPKATPEEIVVVVSMAMTTIKTQAFVASRALINNQPDVAQKLLRDINDTADELKKFVETRS